MDTSFGAGRWKRENSYFSPVLVKATNGLRSSMPFASSSSGTKLSVYEKLYQAIETNDSNSVVDLLEREEEVDVNHVMPSYSMTLLHISVGFSKNETSVVEALLEYGGDPNNTNNEEGLSALHLSVYYDFDRVMSILIKAGGDPTVRSGDGQTCYDIVKQNVEDQLMEKCFAYFFTQSRQFRKSISPVKRTILENESGSDGFFSCDSGNLGPPDELNSQNEELHSVARRLFPKEYSYLMTEDESADIDSSDDDNARKLTTIPEESGIASSPGYSYFSPTTPITPGKRGLNSMTAPYYMDDSISITSEQSCVNSTPPITPQPTKEEMEKLHEQMKTLRIPITPSTFNVISKYAESESGLQQLLTPKTGKCNFSSDLQAGMENLQLIHEWGNHKIDLLQNVTPTANTSKSFYNYLLLDPKIIKRANFSGNHLKTGVINSIEKFEKFLLSVFYIGKGCGKRPLQHLVDSKEKFVEIGRKTLKSGEKINKIVEIWRSGLGVIIVSVFHHSSEREANVNEACMIDAVGLVELSNLKKGSYTGTLASSWPQKTKNQLGSFLLYKCFCAFAVGEYKSFSPADI